MPGWPRPRRLVANARLQLGYAVLTAPANGVVARRAVEVGALVQPGQTLMSLLPTDTVWVTANLKETEIEAVTPGDAAEFSVDAYRDQTFHGHVESISPATGARFALLPPDNATGNFTKVVQRVPVQDRRRSAGPQVSAPARHVGRSDDQDEVAPWRRSYFPRGGSRTGPRSTRPGTSSPSR